MQRQPGGIPRTFFLLALLGASGACTSPAGPPGPVGPQGPQGPAGLSQGWGAQGNDVYLTADGGLGLGTDAPTAKLDVRGSIHVEEDISLSPTQNCRTVKLETPTADLGTHLEALLAKHRCVAVTLKAGTNWTWNVPIVVRADQTLSIGGEGATNGAANITVNILMTQNRTDTSSPPDRRMPGRMTVYDRASFSLSGVNLIESASDTRELTGDCGESSLFNTRGTYSIISLTQMRMQSTEDIVNVASPAFANVIFGHTFIDKTPGSPRDIAPVRLMTGWCFTSAYVFVHNRSASTLGTGVAWSTNALIRYE